MTEDLAEPVGAKEIAARASVGPKAVQRWQERDIGFPAPTWPSVGGRKAWDWSVVRKWLIATGRMEDNPTGSHATVGVVRQASGQWWAAHGLGSYTRELGFFGTRAEAEHAAGVGGRRVVHCEPGETGWIALARGEREAVAGGPVRWMTLGHLVKIIVPARADITLALAERKTPVAHLDRYPPVTESSLTGYSMAGAGPGRDSAGHLVLTRTGEVAWLARGQPRLERDLAGNLRVARSGKVTAEKEILACGGLHLRAAGLDRPADEQRSCPWCLGIAWQGDLEPPWQRRPAREEGQ